MWHSLQDKRVEFKIGPFSSKESSEMIGTLEKTIENKLETPLRRNLLEQAQGVPWLLKKFCIHVYRQLSLGISQRSLLGSKLNAKILFEEDTQDLSSTQLQCLKYIANKSPIDLVEIQESFGPEIIDYLYQNKRLIIKSGYKYSVYWDIFREYLITGEVPHIPITYFPQAQLSTSLSVLRHIFENGPISVEGIMKAFRYTIKTVWNIIGDLFAFSLIKRNTQDELEVAEELKADSDFDNSVADYVAEQLQGHIVLRIIYDNVRPKEEISLSELENLIYTGISDYIT